MDQLFLLGKSLNHSFSSEYFYQKFQKLGIENEYKYSNKEIQSIEGFPSIDFHQCIGFNVTIPYKKEIIPYLDELSDAAQKIQAVNCVKIIQKNNSPYFVGHNTDYIGFIDSISPYLKASHRSALIFGSGGAAKAIAYALNQLNISYQIVSRNGDLSYENLSDQVITNNLLLINTTPVGMFPNENGFLPIPYHEITKQHLVFDAIYNPSETKFLQFAKKQGATILNGYKMLVLQAEESWKIWTSKN